VRVLLQAAGDLLISKPGGLTTAEAFLSKIPVMAIAPLPGQEDENVDYLTGKKAIAIARNKENFGRTVSELLANDQALSTMAENAYKLAAVHGPDIVLELLQTNVYDNDKA